MHRVGVFFLIFLISTVTSFAADFGKLDEQNYQKQLMETGFRILNANDIEQRYTFAYSPLPKTKTKIKANQKKIILYKGYFPSLDSEDELAAVLSHEIAYLSDLRHGIFRRTAMGYSPRKYETKSDKKAIDYMVHAGYNPIGMILVLNKTTGDQNLYEKYILHQNASQRMIAVYDYIYQKYPLFLSENEYLTNPVYQNFLRTSKQERQKIRKIQEERVRLRRLGKEKV